MSKLKVNNIEPINGDELILKGKVIIDDTIIVRPTRTPTPTRTPPFRPCQGSGFKGVGGLQNQTVTINGVTVMTTFGGDVIQVFSTSTSKSWFCIGTFPQGNPTSSPWFVMPPHSTAWVGKTSSFDLMLSFLTGPVNDVVILIVGSGIAFDPNYENFKITTSNGIPTITKLYGCNDVIINNEIFIRASQTNSYSGAGAYRISDPTSNYSSISIKGDGGLLGSYVFMCIPNGYVTPTPTPTPTTTSCNTTCFRYQITNNTQSIVTFYFKDCATQTIVTQDVQQLKTTTVCASDLPYYIDVNSPPFLPSPNLTIRKLSCCDCECYFFDVNILQVYLTDSVGNTDTSLNNVVNLSYINCDDLTVTTKTYSSAGFYPNDICISANDFTTALDYSGAKVDYSNTSYYWFWISINDTIYYSNTGPFFNPNYSSNNPPNSNIPASWISMRLTSDYDCCSQNRDAPSSPTPTPTITKTPGLTPDCPCREIVFINSQPTFFPVAGARVNYIDCDGFIVDKVLLNNRTTIRDCVLNGSQNLSFTNISGSWSYSVSGCCPSVTPTPTLTLNSINCLIARSECGNSIATFNGTINGRPSYIFSFTSVQSTITFTIYWIPTASAWFCSDLQNTVTYYLPTTSIIPVGIWLYYSGNNTGCISLYFNTDYPLSECPTPTPTPTKTTTPTLTKTPTPTPTITKTPTTTPAITSSISPTVTPTSTECCTDWFYLSSRSSGTTGTTYYVVNCDNTTQTFVAPPLTIGTVHCIKSLSVLSQNYDGSHYNDNYPFCTCLPPTPTPTICCSDWSYYSGFISLPPGITAATYYILYCDGSTEIRYVPQFTTGDIYCAQTAVVVNQFGGGSLYRTSTGCTCTTPTPTPTPTPTKTLLPTCRCYELKWFSGGTSTYSYTDCNGVVYNNLTLPQNTITNICSQGSPQSQLFLWSIFVGPCPYTYWMIVEVSENNVYFRGEYDVLTNTLIGFPNQFTAPPYPYNGYMEVRIVNCDNPPPCTIDQWVVLNNTSTRVWPSNQLNSLCGSFTISPYNIP